MVLAPRLVANQLVLAEVLAANDLADGARVALAAAVELATMARTAGDPEATRWLADARVARATCAVPGWMAGATLRDATRDAQRAGALRYACARAARRWPSRGAAISARLVD